MGKIFAYTIKITQKFHGKYVLLTSLDESDELNIWTEIR